MDVHAWNYGKTVSDPDYYIDGLRAVAILLLLDFHACPFSLPGGLLAWDETHFTNSGSRLFVSLLP